MSRELFRLGYSVQMNDAHADLAEVMLYGEIVEDGPEAWKWSKEDKSAAEFDRAIKDARGKGANRLLLRINSPGGVCTESVAMRSILMNAGFEEINIRIEGMCASAATDIATLPGAHVQITEGSEYMIHNPWCLVVGNANDMERTIQRLRNIEDMSRGFYVKRTGQSEEQVREWMDKETWFTADEAVEYGFADEVLSTDGATSPIAACVSRDQAIVMRGLYKTMPESIAIEDEEPSENNVSNGTPAAGVPTEINIEEGNPGMDIKDLNLDELRAENPALFEEIQMSAVNAERARIDEIDALTPPGYEDMAAKAKADGTSSMDFHKMIVKAQKEKGADFMRARVEETNPAQNVAGGAPANNAHTEEQDIRDAAKQIAEYAMQYGGRDSGGMF